MKSNLTMLLAGALDPPAEPIRVPPVPVAAERRPWLSLPPYPRRVPGPLHLPPWLPADSRA